MNIAQDRFTNTLYEFLEETFETHHGIFLDKGTSLFETLEQFDATEASQPVGGQCATLAAQVAHVTFYLEVMERYIKAEPLGKVDWGEIWRTVGAVTPDEWAGLKATLNQTYARVKAMLRARENWDDAIPISGALAIVVHSAYHLGEIRQALCTLRPSRSR
jgi:hypothetical protein